MRGFVAQSADLALIGVDETVFVRRSVQKSALVALGGLLLVIVLFALAGRVHPLVAVLAIVVSPAASWIWSIRRVAHLAAVRRSDMDLAVAVYLDLVNVLLAGGAGVETAMIAAAGSGDGWCFEQIRLSIARAQSSRRSYWDALRELGQRTGVESLEEVANSVQLAGEHGARIRQSLASKAHSLRTRNLARIEHEAEQRTERMGLPVVVLFMGFIMLVGYPAFVGTIGSL